VRTPFISIIMPLYNHEKYVAQAVESVLAQTFEDFELVVCNDGSTDASLERVDAYDDRRIRIIDKPNGGTVSALNSCLMSARGKFVCWLSSDDLFAPGKLAAHAAHHTRDQESMLSFAPFGYLRDDQFLAVSQTKPSSSARLAQFLGGNYVNGLSVCASRTLYAQHGLFDSRFRYAHDVERWFQFLVHHEPAYLEGQSQSFSRLGTGHVTDADMLGELDVLKMVYSRIASGGLRALLPSDIHKQPVTQEQLATLCPHLFSPRNLFFRFRMDHALIHLVAGFVQAEGLGSALAGAAAHLNEHSNSVDIEHMLRCIELTLSASGEAAPIAESPGFAEQLCAMRDGSSSASERRVMSRYLREGM
jgi:hypothetical protein